MPEPLSANLAGAYSGFGSVKRLGVNPLLDGTLIHLRLPSQQTLVPILYSWVESTYYTEFTQEARSPIQALTRPNVASLQ